MSKLNVNGSDEIILSRHSEAQWNRREQELVRWTSNVKLRRRPKQTMLLDQVHVDAELHKALWLLNQKQVKTEYSCAGVSVLDEPEDHSLYAYLTICASKEADHFVQLAMMRMKHRLMVTYEPERNRYDLSSFYIGHNRSFCLLLERSADLFNNIERSRNEGVK
ncbi:hypothetical protein B5M42_002430 [Paenibacillus athensensis]|uniref:Uncharacterized protein n=1 Tax=Paenibacillus athensensis TaxID=1967502 RepID=A0A4Y8QA70_9BACL|nr:hypothetical protein [Paenibacillus athensensis]MCD1257696.1 hypothetical protein [Paenibacillus athensensis]